MLKSKYQQIADVLIPNLTVCLKPKF